MAQKFGVRIRRVRPGLPVNSPAIIPAAGIEYSAAVSSLPVLRFDVQQVALGAMLTEGEELAVEFWDGEKWREPEAWSRFIVLGLSYDELDVTLATSVTCIGRVEFLLAGAKLHSTDGEGRTYADGVGVIAFHPVDEAQARGALKGVTVAYSALKDSRGSAWSTSKVELELSAGQSALEILTALADQGLIEFWSRGHELVVVKPGTGTQRETTYIGRRATEVPYTSSAQDYATALILRDDDGRAHEFAATDSLGLGRIEAEQNTAGVTNASTMSLLGQLAAVQARVKKSITVSEDVAAVDASPLIDYEPSDSVFVRRRLMGRWELMTVTEIQVTRESDATLTLHVGLNDRLASLEEKLAKRAESLGASVGGSGRAKLGGGGSGAGSVTYAYVADDFSAGTRIYTTSTPGGTDRQGPYEYVDDYRPASRDRVAIVGGLIIGRVMGTADTSQGTVEVLDPIGGWKVARPDRFGPVQITRTSTDWVIMSGVVEAPGDSDDVLQLPGAYRPLLPLRILATGVNTSSGMPGADSDAYIDISTTGVVSARYQSGGYTYSFFAGQWLSLCDVAFNVSEDGLIVESGKSARVTDALGMTAFFGERIVSDPVIAAGARPGVDVVSRSIGPYGYPEVTVHPDGTITDGSGFGSGFRSTAGVRAQGDRNDLIWNQPSLQGGFQTDPTYAAAYGRRADGIAILRGKIGSGIAGQIAAVLPPGFRPTYDQPRREYLLSASGSIIPANTFARFYEGLFMATH